MLAEGSVSNSGTINAAVAELRAAGGNHYALAINNTGVVRATGVTQTREGGFICQPNAVGSKVVAELSPSALGGAAARSFIKTAKQGAVDISGEINVVGSTGKGGLVVVEANEITIASGSQN